jgi:hypothetical protein
VQAISFHRFDFALNEVLCPQQCAEEFMVFIRLAKAAEGIIGFRSLQTPPR